MAYECCNIDCYGKSKGVYNMYGTKVPLEQSLVVPIIISDTKGPNDVNILYAIYIYIFSLVNILLFNYNNEKDRFKMFIFTIYFLRVLMKIIKLVLCHYRQQQCLVSGCQSITCVSSGANSWFWCLFVHCLTV